MHRFITSNASVGRADVSSRTQRFAERAKIVSAVVGHGQASTTLNIYGRVGDLLAKPRLGTRPPRSGADNPSTRDALLRPNCNQSGRGTRLLIWCCSRNAYKIETNHVRARSSNWIEQGTPKPKVASSILAGRTIVTELGRPSFDGA